MARGAGCLNWARPDLGGAEVGNCPGLPDRGGLGRGLFSPVARPFVRGCPTISTVLRFHTPLIEPEVPNKLHAQSHLPQRPPSRLSSGYRRCSSWSTGSTRAGRTLNKEHLHASTPDSHSPPPPPAPAPSPSAFPRLCPTLPAESRERILN